MKKVLPVILILTFCLNIYAQNEKSATPDLQEANKSSGEVVKLFSQKKFAEALPFAQKAVSLYEKALGAEHFEVGKALRNLGYVNYYLDDKKEAQKSFERALEIYEKQAQLSKSDGLLMAGMLEILAVIKYGNDKTQTTENLIEKLLAVYEKYGEGNSLKAANGWLALGNFRSAEKSYGKAAEFYEKSLAIRHKLLGEEDFETIDAFDRSLCALKKDDQEKEIERVRATFFPSKELTDDGTLKREKKEMKGKSDDGKQKQPDRVPIDDKTITGIPLNQPFETGVINGKALSLPKPAYSVEARRVRAGGTVKVTVKINEEGNVIYACGAFNKTHEALILASEAAAFGAKFQPTTQDGKPVKVTGIIVYNFVP